MLRIKPLVKMNIISPSLAKEISIYLKIEEDKLQRIDIFKAVKIQRNGFDFYSKQCGRVKQNNSYTVLLQQPINGCDIIQVEYFIHISSPRKTIGVCSGFQLGSQLGKRKGTSYTSIGTQKVIFFIVLQRLELWAKAFVFLLGREGSETNKVLVI